VLVLISDLHLSDGTTANNFNPQAFNVLAGEIEAAADKPEVREVRLILLGDVFDFVRTNYFHANVPANQRPWGGDLDPVTAMNQDAAGVEAHFQKVLQRILAAEDPQCGLGSFLNSLKTICDDKKIPLFVTYVIGNHDRVLNNFPALQASIQQVYPLIGEFTNVYASQDYAIVARHGHEWDQNCHGFDFLKKVLKSAPAPTRFGAETYRVMSIGEVVTAELMSGLIHYASEGGADPDLVQRLKDVNNLRPMINVFEWLNWFGGTRTITKKQKDILHDAMVRALSGVVDSSLARKWDELTTDIVVSGDLVDRLQLIRRLLVGQSFDDFSNKVGALERLQAAFNLLGGSDELVAGAQQEYAIGQKGVKPSAPKGTQYILYGHTHYARHDYFTAQTDGQVQMYVNTGTFQPLISRAADHKSFANEVQMTMVYVYSGQEDTKGKVVGTTSLDIWNGSRLKRFQ
jgi:UDP-2,3-diacylglucosamine pyrophosphatase LpxH